MDYRNFWMEFIAIKDASKKKLLKKHNPSESISKFLQLSAVMEDEELPEHAGLCHCEIAMCYEGMQYFPAEHQHLIKAANLFFTARMIQHRLCVTMTPDAETHMEECYLKVIEKLTKRGFMKIAGVTCIEVAEKFQKFSNFERAYDYLLKGNRLIQTDVYVNAQILQKMCAIATKQLCMDEVLAEIQTIWSSLLKELPFVGAVREMLLKIELHIILLNLKHFLSTNDSQRLILQQYNDASQWQCLKLSVMNRDEFSIVSRFIASISAKRFVEASNIYTFNLYKFLDGNTRQIAIELLDSIDNEKVIDRGFDEIRQSVEFSELEKRQKIFELYNGLVRKNQSKLEYL